MLTSTPPVKISTAFLEIRKGKGRTSPVVSKAGVRTKSARASYARTDDRGVFMLRNLADALAVRVVSWCSLGGGWDNAELVSSAASSWHYTKKKNIINIIIV